MPIDITLFQGGGTMVRTWHKALKIRYPSSNEYFHLFAGVELMRRNFTKNKNISLFIDDDSFLAHHGLCR